MRESDSRSIRAGGFRPQQRLPGLVRRVTRAREALRRLEGAQKESAAAAMDYRRQTGSADYRKVVALDRKREEDGSYRPASDFGAPSLPAWWLSMQQLANVPANISFTLVCSILLPSEVARIVPDSQKAERLGTAAMIGAVAQVCTQATRGLLVSRQPSTHQRHWLCECADHT